MNQLAMPNSQVQMPNAIRVGNWELEMDDVDDLVDAYSAGTRLIWLQDVATGGAAPFTIASSRSAKYA